MGAPVALGVGEGDTDSGGALTGAFVSDGVGEAAGGEESGKGAVGSGESALVLLEGVAEGGGLRFAAQLGSQLLRQFLPEGLLRLHVKEDLPLLPHQVLKDLDPIAPEGLALFLHDVDEVVYGIRLVLNRIDERLDPVAHVRLP